MSARSTALLAELAAMSPDALQDAQTRLGGVLHRRLVDLAATGFGGVVFSAGACPGLGDALTSYDGSSDYVRGDLTPVGPAAVAALAGSPFRASDAGAAYAAQLGSGVRAFLRHHRLPGELLVMVNGAAGEPSPVRIEVDDGSIALTDEVEIPSAGIAATTGATDRLGLRRRQHLAAIGALFALGRWLDRTAGPGGVEAELERGLHTAAPAPTEPDASRLAAVESLVAMNREAWDAVRSGLATGTRLSVGESFTFGRLARLLCSQPGFTDVVNFLYGWYEPGFKRAMRVPPARLSDREIAEPRTVDLAAHGLLDHAPGTTTIAVATSGWANNTWLPDRDGRHADFFSVAVAGRDAADRDRTVGETLRCSVTSTAGGEMSHGRRQLTRELGVSAALVVLLRHVGADGDRRHHLDLLTRQLDRFGTFELAPSAGGPGAAGGC